jgi:hypothetical protein
MSEPQTVREVRPGDEIVVVGHRLGETARSGEILEVLGTSDRPHYRVRWDDGHESVVYPSSDATIRRLGEEGRR